MNLSVLVESLKYVNDFKLIILAASWIYYELSVIKYTDSKLIKSFFYDDLDTSEAILQTNKHRQTDTLLDSLLYKSMSFLVTDKYRRVKLLLESGADVHVNQDYIFRKAFHLNPGNIKLIKLLLQYDSKLYNNNPDRLAVSAGYGNIALVEIGLKLGIKITDDAMLFACRNGREHVVKLLLEAYADKYIQSEKPLHDAILRNHPKIVRMLLERYENPSLINIFNILSTPPTNICDEVFEILLEFNVKVPRLRLRELNLI